MSERKINLEPKLNQIQWSSWGDFIRNSRIGLEKGGQVKINEHILLLMGQLIRLNFLEGNLNKLEAICLLFPKRFQSLCSNVTTTNLNKWMIQNHKFKKIEDVIWEFSHNEIR